MRSSIMGLAWLIAVFSVPVWAAGVREYARPESDALIYLDVGQAEKSMDKELWKRIDADKKSAGKGGRKGDTEEDGAEGEDFIGGLMNLNPELLANVTLVSRDPLRLMVEGAVRFQSGGSGTVEKALDDFFNGLAGEDVKVAKEGDGKRLVRKATLSSDEASEPMSLTVTSSGTGMYEFLVLFNLKRKVNLPPPAPSPARGRMGEAFLAGDPSACLLMNSIRWVPLLPRNGESRALMRLMRLADSVGCAVTVKGRLIHLQAEAAFRRERDAALYAQDAENMSREMEKLLSGPILRRLTSARRGLSVALSAEIDIGESWACLWRLLDSGHVAEAKKNVAH